MSAPPPPPQPPKGVIRGPVFTLEGWAPPVNSLCAIFNSTPVDYLDLWQRLHLVCAAWQERGMPFIKNRCAPGQHCDRSVSTWYTFGNVSICAVCGKMHFCTGRNCRAAASGAGGDGVLSAAASAGVDGDEDDDDGGGVGSGGSLPVCPYSGVVTRPGEYPEAYTWDDEVAARSRRFEPRVHRADALRLNPSGILPERNGVVGIQRNLDEPDTASSRTTGVRLCRSATGGAPIDDTKRHSEAVTILRCVMLSEARRRFDRRARGAASGAGSAAGAAAFTENDVTRAVDDVAALAVRLWGEMHAEIRLARTRNATYLDSVIPGVCRRFIEHVLTVATFSGMSSGLVFGTHGTVTIVPPNAIFVQRMPKPPDVLALNALRSEVHFPRYTAARSAFNNFWLRVVQVRHPTFF